MEVIIILSIVITLSAFIGFKIGTWHSRKLNATLNEQNKLLKEYAQHWAGESTARFELYGKASQHNTHNMATTMQIIIQLLHTLKKDTLTGNEHNTISDIINKAKTLYPQSEFER
jgi:uncharacterized protein YukE